MPGLPLHRVPRLGLIPCLIHGSAPCSPCIVHHNEPLARAPLFRVVVGLPAIIMKDWLTWYEYVGV
jgi:hypothetical protein